jgi:hypothetical protein
MATVSQFQHLLLTDPAARSEFSSNPKAFIEKHGIVLPPGTKVPTSIPKGELDHAVSVVTKHLGTGNISSLQNDTAAVSKFVQSAFPPKASASELNKIKGAIASGQAGVASRVADDATVAVIAVVVALPVAVFGRTAPEEEAE